MGSLKLKGLQIRALKKGAFAGEVTAPIFDFKRMFRDDVLSILLLFFTVCTFSLEVRGIKYFMLNIKRPWAHFIGAY